MNIMPLTAHTVQIGSGTAAIVLDKFSGVMDLSKQGQQGIILIQNIVFNDNDLNTPIVALNDKRMLYSFGKNFGHVQVQGTIYNSKCQGSPDFTSLKNMYDTFCKERVSESLGTMMLSVASGFKCDLFLTDFALNNANPATQSIGFSLQGIVVPPTNKGE